MTNDLALNPDDCPSPCYVVDTGRLRRNLERLASVRERTDTSLLLALKGFAMFATFPLVRQFLDGICASGLNEARLGREEFDSPGMHKQVHTYSPAFKATEFPQIVALSDHITFNSMAQWRAFGPAALQAGVVCGLRVNPECSVADVPLYDPCAPGSRLGVRRDKIEASALAGVTGLHVHALCEQDTHALARVLAALEARFGTMLHGMEWLNLGGGHHVTRPDYDIDHLCTMLTGLRERYGLKLYIEPGEAVALDAGVLVAQVLDIVASSQGHTAILDISVTCHMPDVLEMPYRPRVVGTAGEGEKDYTYTLAGNSCLAGDIVGAYSFDAPLKPGDRLVFEDMAHYTMVKSTMFNGVPHPSIATWCPETGSLDVIRRFDYHDYRNRLS